MAAFLKEISIGSITRKLRSVQMSAEE